MNGEEEKERRQGLFYLLEGAVCGLLAGSLAVGYRLALEGAGVLLDLGLEMGRTHLWFLPLWFALLMALAFLVYRLTRWAPEIKGGGVPRVMGELDGAFDAPWLRTVLAKFLGGTLCALAGLSLGRAGPSVQLGAMAGKGLSLLGKRERQERRLMLTCGAAAGIAATFNAPFAGILFALEALRRDFRPRMLTPCMAAAVCADYVASAPFGLTPLFRFSLNGPMGWRMGPFLVLLGAFLGVLGALYSKGVEKGQGLYGKISWESGRLLIPFLAAGVLGFWVPEALGSGAGLMGLLVEGLPALPVLLGLLAAKTALSLLSFCSGAPGGLFLPVLSMGALWGGVWAYLMAGLGLSGDWTASWVILAMGGFFAAVVRAPLTAAMLCLEMTGSFSHLLAVAMVCLTAQAVSGLLGMPPIYRRLRRQLDTGKKGLTNGIETGKMKA